MNKSRRVLGTWEQGRSERSTPKSQNTGEGKGWTRDTESLGLNEQSTMVGLFGTETYEERKQVRPGSPSYDSKRKGKE